MQSLVATPAFVFELSKDKSRGPFALPPPERARVNSLPAELLSAEATKVCWLMSPGQVAD